MKNSDNEFGLLQPSLIDDGKGIQAWFTLKNHQFKPAERPVAGLNLGFNTPDSTDIVKQNRSLLLSELDLDAQWLAYADQVHGSHVRVISEGGTYGATDGLVTSLPGLTLAIQVADCAAVLLWDSTNNVIGALHAGWRGAVAGILSEGIQMMKQQGAELEQMNAFISPCISQAHFEVGPEVAEQFPEPFVERSRYAKPHVDLKGVLGQQIADQGLKRTNIEVSKACTFADDEHFYSYRREGEESGRMMGLIQIKR